MPTGLKIPKLWPQITPSEPIKAENYVLYSLYLLHIGNDIMRHAAIIRRTCADQRVRRRKPHGKHSQRYIRRRRSARYLRQTCVFLPKSGRYTSENNSLVCISYIITSPLSKISDLFVFRASCFLSLPGDKKLASIVKYPLRKAAGKVCRELSCRAQSYFSPLRSTFMTRITLVCAGHRGLGRTCIG